MDVKSIGIAAVAAMGLAGGALAQDNDLAEGEKLYISQCRVCHGDNSGGKLGGRAPLRLALAGAGHGAGASAGGSATRTDAPGLLAFAPPFGPNLRGIVGRLAGTYPEFEYSKPFLKALTGMTWTEGTLDWWIRDTQAWVPGTIMFYKQKDPEIRRKIIVYLASNPNP
jgi:cytochrome c